MAFDLDPSYRSVTERIVDFKALYPAGCLRPADLANPYRIETLGDRTFIVFVAAAFRTPDDPAPGIGTAWEPFPGRTPYTRDSELQNAETSAWGRAIVAVLASESKSVASAEDVRNRRADADTPPPRLFMSPKSVENFTAKCAELGVDPADVVLAATDQRTDKPAGVYADEASALRDALSAVPAGVAEGGA